MSHSSLLPSCAPTGDLSPSPISRASHTLDPFLLESSESLVSPPPDYISSQVPPKLPSYLASVLQPVPAPAGAPPVLRSYALVPHDRTSLIVVPPVAALGHHTASLASARFAIRFYSSSIFLYKAPAADSSSAGDPEAIFGHPIMEACLNRLVRTRDAQLDDWRESAKSGIGLYKLRSQKGGHTYSIAGRQRRWTPDATRCLYLSDPSSPQGSALACLKPATMAASAHSGIVYHHGRTRPSTFSPTGFWGPRTACDRLLHLIGRLDFYHEGVMDNGLEEELVILTCVATHVINQKSKKY